MGHIVAAYLNIIAVGIFVFLMERLVIIYLDNAATSFPKPDSVYEGIEKCMRYYCANPGRGGHFMSLASGRMVFDTRQALCTFFNFNDPMRLCFTKNATEALNIAIRGILKQGDHVITTCMEHNSVMRPLHTLEKDIGISISILGSNPFGEIDPYDLRKKITSKTKLIISTFSSNVNGIIMPLKQLGTIAKEHNILFLVDASQGAGYIPLDIKAVNADLVAFPGHKGLLGPQGTGGLFVREGVNLTSLMQGGTGSFSEYEIQPDIMPDLLESGTLNTPGIAGLSEGVAYINRIGIENLRNFKHKLIQRLYEGVYEIKGISVYSINDINRNSGILAFNFHNADSTEVSYILDKEYGIASRAGLHCSPGAHKLFGTIKKGVVRLSVGCFNTISDIDETLKALAAISIKLY